MKKAIIAILALTITTIAASAQDGGLNRRVEVTKTYTPEVAAADKLYPQPNMKDTVALRPDISYSIRPAAWQTIFGVKPITAALIDTRMETPQPMLYVKAGAGFPLQSVVDVYVHSKGVRGALGAYLNHYGQWSDIADDSNQSRTARWTTNRLGIYGKMPVGEGRLTLTGGLDYDWDYFTRYGLAVPASHPLFDINGAPAAGYSSPEGRICFGNDFSDLSYLNFRVGASGYYYAARENGTEGGVSVLADAGRGWGDNRLTAGVRFDGFYGNHNDAGDDRYRNTIFSVTPLYSLQKPKMKVSFGFDISVDNHPNVTDVWFFPKFSINWDVSSGYFVPFVDIDGRLVNNGMRSLSRLNPYVLPGQVSDRNTACYEGYAGISGSISSVFSYKVYAGAGYYRSHLGLAYYYASGYNGGFLPVVQDVLQLTLGGDISGRIAGGLEAIAALRLHAYPRNTASMERPADMPNMEADLTVRYTYRDRLTVEGGIGVTGKRYFFATLPNEVFFLDGTAPVTADLHLQADYRFMKHWGVFVEGRNLLNTRLYPYDHYRGLGVNVLAGVKITF